MFDITADRVTLIATPSGDVPAGSILPGMTVTLARGGLAAVAWVGRRRRVGEACWIAVGPGALGNGLPTRELRLSPDHAIFAGGLMVPVGLLANGRSIVRLDPATADCLHIELDRHDIILAEQAPVETYREALDRSFFANARVAALRPRLRAVSYEAMFDPTWLRHLRARLDAIADGDRAAS